MLQAKSGKPVFPVGIGTWGMGGTWQKVTGNEQTSIDAIHYSVSKGQNLIDSGQIYGAGYTDEIIGRALKGLSREDLYVTDKVWETNVGNGLVKPAVEEMLNKLGTDYLDMLYIHKPWTDWPWREAVVQINELIDSGVVKQFGVSNFNLAQMKEAIKLSHHPVAVNQLHYNISYRDEMPQAMVEFCKKNQIQIIAYRPLEQGAVLDNKQVQAVAKSKAVTPAQIALAWLLHKGTMVIPMALDEKYIDQNIAAASVKLSPEELAQLDNL